MQLRLVELMVFRGLLVLALSVFFILFFFLIVVGVFCFFFFLQAEDGIRDADVTGVQTCALPICQPPLAVVTGNYAWDRLDDSRLDNPCPGSGPGAETVGAHASHGLVGGSHRSGGGGRCTGGKIGRASCRERVEVSVVVVAFGRYE